MLKEAETYEEAVEIIKKSTEDRAITIRGYGVLFLRWLFITAIAIVLVVTIMRPFLFMSIICMGLISVPNVIPICSYAINRRKIKNGKYFEGKSSTEIIHEANDYVEWRNTLKRLGKIK